VCVCVSEWAKNSRARDLGAANDKTAVMRWRNVRQVGKSSDILFIFTELYFAK